jgi:hypothetical protein
MAFPPMYTKRCTTLPWLRTVALHVFVQQWERGSGDRAFWGAVSMVSETDKTRLHSLHIFVAVQGCCHFNKGTNSLDYPAQPARLSPQGNLESLPRQDSLQP